MTLTRAHAYGVVADYITAWEQQAPDQIVALFTPDGSYHERVLGEPMRGHAAIRRYWETKVVGSQGNIQCVLLNLYLDGDTVIAEWEAEFDDCEKGVRKLMREVAILEFEDGLIASLREVWASKAVGALEESGANP